jgi:hypothetical protein
MTTYLVTWTIDIEADSPREAAVAALRIQRDPESIATVFKVQESRERLAGTVELLDDGTRIDLTELDESEQRREELIESLADTHDAEGGDDSAWLAWLLSVRSDPDHPNHAEAVELHRIEHPEESNG